MTDIQQKRTIRDAIQWFLPDKSTTNRSESLRKWVEEEPDNKQELAGMLKIWDGMEPLRDDPDLAADRLAAVTAEQQSTVVSKTGNKTRVPLWWSAGLAASLVVISLSVWLVQTMAYRADIYSTGIGEQKSLSLADGSEVNLNTDTRIRVIYSDDKRQIDLQRGEALFSVAHDPLRAFEVIADNVSARALGTEFVVYKKGKEVSVTVLDGHVRVQHVVQDETLESNLHKGEGVAFVDDNESISLASKELARIQAWRDGRIKFDSSSLREVVEELNRYREHKFVIGSEELNELAVSGAFAIADSDQFLKTLAMTFPVKIVEQRNTSLIVSSNQF